MTINCPRCNSDSAVKDSRTRAEYRIRRRECERCGHRYTTYETTEIPATNVLMQRAAALPEEVRWVMDRQIRGYIDRMVSINDTLFSSAPGVGDMASAERRGRGRASRRLARAASAGGSPGAGIGDRANTSPTIASGVGEPE